MVVPHVNLCDDNADDDNDAILFEKIKSGEYDADDPVWDHVSDDAKDLVARLLVVDASRRLTAGQALKHPWLQVSALVSTVQRSWSLQLGAQPMHSLSYLAHLSSCARYRARHVANSHSSRSPLFGLCANLLLLSVSLAGHSC